MYLPLSGLNIRFRFFFPGFGRPAAAGNQTGAAELPMFPVFSSAGCGQSFVFWGNKTVGGKFFFFCGVFFAKAQKIGKNGKCYWKKPVFIDEFSIIYDKCNN